MDSETGQTRNSRVADVEFNARLCEGLDHVDLIGIPVMPQDMSRADMSLLYGVRAVIENSRKPVYFSTDNLEVRNNFV